MMEFVPEKQHLREALLFCFNLKKTAAESHRMLTEAYGQYALSEPTCREWFRRFKNGDFEVRDKERSGQPKKFQDDELATLLDEDPTQTLGKLATTLNVDRSTVGKRLHTMGFIQKQGVWVPHELTERAIATRLTMCDLLLQRQKRKSFLHRIVTGDEKWIYYDNPKRPKAWVKPGEPGPSTPKRNIHCSKVMLCIWWDQEGVLYYELLPSNQTITAERYKQQLIDLSIAMKKIRPQYSARHDKVIFQHDNARPHVAKIVKDQLEELGWEILPHPPYSPDVAPSDYHLFRSMASDLAKEQFNSETEVRNWIDRWIASKQRDFFWRGIHKLPERWEKVVSAEGEYFSED